MNTLVKVLLSAGGRCCTSCAILGGVTQRQVPPIVLPLVRRVGATGALIGKKMDKAAAEVKQN